MSGFVSSFISNDFGITIVEIIHKTKKKMNRFWEAGFYLKILFSGREGRGCLSLLFSLSEQVCEGIGHPFNFLNFVSFLRAAGRCEGCGIALWDGQKAHWHVSYTLRHIKANDREKHPSTHKHITKIHTNKGTRNLQAEIQSVFATTREKSKQVKPENQMNMNMGA